MFCKKRVVFSECLVTFLQVSLQQLLKKLATLAAYYLIKTNPIRLHNRLF